MKKFFTAVCSFALILFMGLAVGCSTTDAAKIRVSSVTEGFSYTGTTTITLKPKVDYVDDGEGLVLTVYKDNSFGTNYKATFSDIASGYTLSAISQINSGSVVEFDSNGRLAITIKGNTVLSGSSVTLFKMTISAETTNDKKISQFNSTTYQVVLALPDTTEA